MNRRAGMVAMPIIVGFMVQLSGCAEALTESQHSSSTVDRALKLPVVMSPGSPGRIISGVEARNMNWQAAVKRAGNGDSSALKIMQQLQAAEAPFKATVIPRSDDLLRSHAGAFKDETVSETVALAVIYVSSTWPATIDPGALGGDMFFLGENASSTADYRVSDRGLRSGGFDWASAGTNSSAATPYHDSGFCVSQSPRVANCPYLYQQASNFSITGIPHCDITLWARGNHEAWFSSGSVDVGFLVLGVNFTFHVNVTGGGTHATEANAQNYSDGPWCDDLDEYEEVGGGEDGGGGGECPPGKAAFWWYHDSGYGLTLQGTVCLDAIGGGAAGTRAYVSTGVATAPQKLEGQPSERSTASAQATLVVAQLPAGQRVQIVRRASLLPAQIILVDNSATSEDLTLAIGTLGAMRATDGSAQPVDQTAAVYGRVKELTPQDRGVAQAAAYLTQLRSAHVANIPGVSAAAALEIDLGTVPKLRQKL